MPKIATAPYKITELSILKFLTLHNIFLQSVNKYPQGLGIYGGHGAVLPKHWGVEQNTIIFHLIA
jgi:hypothetical protein